MDTESQLPAEVTFAGYRCRVVKTSYAHGGALALQLVDADDGAPVAMATVNLAGFSEYLEGEVLVKDYSECEGMLAALEDAGVVYTGRRLRTGFVEIPVARLLI